MHVGVLVILGLKDLGDSLYSKSKHHHYHYELLFLMSLILFTATTADAHISILSGQINLSKLLINIPGRILDFITAFPGLGRRRQSCPFKSAFHSLPAKPKGHQTGIPC